ncbi:hypothetical protein FY528_09060 [Hymenobacter lutimineralis]|uniref:NTF2 fold domain-containing protein n=1 Tax=Hymenobacter lutimineralis TaxID=2606448 RepID=A0A5D6V3G5_9BACT|nr:MULTISPECIES: hypothetical protein [Hymenobacter]QIX63094.1 hypothetical protein HER32_18730 [Hymenobacter sp. BT18]TYZ10601.1 hypothetical protein FY528_09060 [Hymenobacter lutimineralis]
MRYFFLLALIGPAFLSNCQQPTADTPTATATATVAASAQTEADARAAVARFVTGQPNAALYQLDSASVVDAGTQWQVLVPRTDWAGRMPDKAAFEVTKQNGQVKSLMVK